MIRATTGTTDVFETVLMHLRTKGPVNVATAAGDLVVQADSCVSQIYVRDPEILFWFAFYPWFSGMRAYARRQIQHGDVETPTLELPIPATPAALMSKMAKVSSDYILKVRRGV